MTVTLNLTFDAPTIEMAIVQVRVSSGNHHRIIKSVANNDADQYVIVSAGGFLERDPDGKALTLPYVQACARASEIVSTLALKDAAAAAARKEVS